MTTAHRPAGWYDDPENDERLRWWDGTSWADLTQARGAQSISSDVKATAHATASPDADEYASAGERLGAFVLDVAIAFAVILAAAIISFILGILPDGLAALLSAVTTIAAWGLAFILTVVALGRVGQSYGKHLMGIRAVSTYTHKPIGIAPAFGREIIRSIGMYVFGLGVLWILWDPARQGWHDKAVSSIVIRSGDRAKQDPLTFLRTVLDR